MPCCDPSIIDDKEAVGVCKACGEDINKDGECVEDVCSYSPLSCNECGYQTCDQSC